MYIEKIIQLEDCCIFRDHYDDAYFPEDIGNDGFSNVRVFPDKTIAIGLCGDSPFRIPENDEVEDSRYLKFYELFSVKDSLETFNKDILVSSNYGKSAVTISKYVKSLESPKEIDFKTAINSITFRDQTKDNKINIPNFKCITPVIYFENCVIDDFDNKIGFKAKKYRFNSSTMSGISFNIDNCSENQKRYYSEFELEAHDSNISGDFFNYDYFDIYQSKAAFKEMHVYTSMKIRHSTINVDKLFVEKPNYDKRGVKRFVVTAENADITIKELNVSNDVQRLTIRTKGPVTIESFGSVPEDFIIECNPYSSDFIVLGKKITKEAVRFRKGKY